jgi:formamidopyrimidine-DNA glycosylase
VPELPEVETTARGLRAAVVGKTVADAGSVDWPRMLPNATAEQIAAALRGRRVLGVDRRGKYLLLAFEGGLSLAIHRKMSGNLLLRPPAAPPEPHLHFELVFADGSRLRFVDPRKFGRVYLFESPDEQAAFMDDRLGPEPLAELDGRALAGRLAGRRARIKTLLLDQSVLAGVGNLYADEALWEAGIHPARPADSLDAGELDRLAEAIQRVLLLAIERRGTSFSSYLDAEGSPGENQDFLRVYGREGEACPRCGGPIRRVTMAQRSSHFCPTCQRQCSGS